MMTHPTDDELNDYHDGLLAPDAEAALEAHLTECVECEDRSALIAELLDQLHGVPRAIEPPEHVWTALRKVIDREKGAAIGESAPAEREAIALSVVQPLVERETAVGIGESPAVEQESIPAIAQSTARPRRARTVVLAAAAVLLVIASTAVMRWAMTDTTADADAAITRRLASRQSLARFVEVEAQYLQAANDLMEAIERERRMIPPDITARAQQSLTVIDQAVREVRSALADDPENAALADMALAAHRKKLELLEQVRQWSSES